MSHCVSIAITIHDLDALAAAVAELGGQLVRNVTSYNWYGRSVGDYPLPAGITVDMLGHCQHVIRFPGVRYEIGLVKTAQGWVPLFDFYGYDGNEMHDGHKLLERIASPAALAAIKSAVGYEAQAKATAEAAKAGKLCQLYGVHKATLAARKQGLAVRRVTAGNGSIKLVCTGRGL